MSFALAFGIDYTRLSEVSSYFGSWVPADVLWLALLIVFSLTLINTPVTQSDPARGNGISDYLYAHTRGIRKIALWSAIVWVFFVFVLLRIEVLASLIAPLSGIITTGMQWLYWIVCMINGVYLYLWKKQTGGRLWANLLGKDIL